MDDQNKPTNQPSINPNMPKSEESDVTTSAPVEMEPSTRPADTNPQAPAQGMPQPGQPLQPTSVPTSDPVMQPQETQQPASQPLLEAPKKNTVLMVGVVVAIIVVLAVVGVLIYQAM